MKKLSLLGILELTACAVSAHTRWAAPTDFALTIFDNPSLKRFDLTLTSHALTLLCLPKYAWPSEGGLPVGFDGAGVITRSGLKASLPNGSAYCPGGCGEVRLKPNQSIRGVLPYAAFEDVAAIISDSHRALDFKVYPYVCSK